MQELTKPVDSAFNLGQWVGRREAFGLVAGRCSAAEIEILRRIRDEHLYEETGLSWDAFCTDRLHTSRRTVEREIGYLRKHGPAFFVIRQLTRVTVKEYEAIAANISEQGVTLDGKLIEASSENSDELTAAVGELVKRCVSAEPKLESSAAPAYDSVLKQCRNTVSMLDGFDESLSEEQKMELANVVAAIRVKAMLLGAIY